MARAWLATQEGEMMWFLIKCVLFGMKIVQLFHLAVIAAFVPHTTQYLGGVIPVFFHVDDEMAERGLISRLHL